ncbi:hypothetical protein LZ30DRAFT_63916 [Colletotrichum cereale]|nr:hypothetical protein LZ30DRAFT_63916 [Colletotrichum cereale]
MPRWSPEAYILWYLLTLVFGIRVAQCSNDPSLDYFIVSSLPRDLSWRLFQLPNVIAFVIKLCVHARMPTESKSCFVSPPFFLTCIMRAMLQQRAYVAKLLNSAFLQP